MLGTRIAWGWRFRHVGAVTLVETPDRQEESKVDQSVSGWAGRPGSGEYVRGKSLSALGDGAMGVVCINTTRCSCTVSDDTTLCSWTETGKVRRRSDTMSFAGSGTVGAVLDDGEEEERGKVFEIFCESGEKNLTGEVISVNSVREIFDGS